jgi:hypothetical protein
MEPLSTIRSDTIFELVVPSFLRFERGVPRIETMKSIQSPKAIAAWIRTTFSQFPDEIAATDQGKQPTHNEPRSRSVRWSSSLAGNGYFFPSGISSTNGHRDHLSPESGLSFNGARSNSCGDTFEFGRALFWSAPSSPISSTSALPETEENAADLIYSLGSTVDLKARL